MECDAFMLKKSIGIVTLQDSPNCGARLQALAMFLTLKMFTFDVHFLKTNARSVVKRNLKNIVKKIIKCRFKHAFFLIRQIYSYSSSKIRFQSQNFTEFKRKDIVVFGSDEIWNVSRKSISQYPFFWGAELSAHKISFAPSINSATITDFEKMKLQDDFSEFKAISVRDFHSQNVLETFLNKKIDVVCDPTMLLSAKQWYGYEKECSRKSDFILLYAYGRQFNQDDIKKILAFAREENLAIVSALVYYEFADENLPCNPEQYQELFLGLSSLTIWLFLYFLQPYLSNPCNFYYSEIQHPRHIHYNWIQDFQQAILFLVFPILRISVNPFLMNLEALLVHLLQLLYHHLPYNQSRYR